jgi:glycosyltransferase involved in cell wall biosynthesis
MRIIYVANARLPTEKAHGYQIVSMCEAFAQQGAEVELAYPRRHQVDPSLRGVSIYDYYGVPAVFRSRELAGLDVTQWSGVLPAPVMTAACLVRSYTWAWHASRALTSQPIPDIFYTRDPAIALFLARRRAPVIFESHMVPRRFQRVVFRRLARERSLLMTSALTGFIREGLLNLGFRPDRVMVHPDAVDARRFQDLPDIRSSRRALGLDLDGPIVGYVGRFTALGLEKGIAQLIDAVAAIRRDTRLDPVLLCVGGPADVIPEYRRQAEARGLPERALHLVDRVPPSEVPLWIRACDVVTIPWGWNQFSAYFTSPLKLFEYLAAGLPIVASDLPALREVLTDGENAVLVSPGKPEALAAGLLRVLTDAELRRTLAANALQTAKRHTWNGRAASILAELQGLAKS